MSDWIYLQFEISPQDLETVSSLLWDLGTSGIEERNFDQARVRVKAYFLGGTPIRKIQHDFTLWCRQRGIQIDALSIHTQETRDWLAEWRSQWNPFPVGKRFFVIPLKDAKHTAPLRRIPLLLEPGMAFGTGTHETTQLCLESLESILSTGLSLLDVGTGSGILAIAALKLGARRSVGIDIDPEAIAVARENARINDCGKKIQWQVGDIETMGRRKFDLLAANLAIDPIEKTLPSMSRRLKPGGTMILSGLLKGQEERLTPRLGPSQLTKIRVRSQGEWIAIILRKQHR
jgi:ribosomal protein L11 methyltransferase